MASEKKGTGREFSDKAIPARGNRWWHLLEAEKEFRHDSQYSFDTREESALMAKHLELMHRDAEYRAQVFAALERYLDGSPNRRAASLRTHQARDFLEFVRVFVTYQQPDFRHGVEGLLMMAIHVDPLVMVGARAPRLTKALVDEAERAVRHELDYSEANTEEDLRRRNLAVARAVLRVIYRSAGMKPNEIKAAIAKVYPSRRGKQP